MWSSRDVSRIVEELRTTYPYTYSDLHDDVGNVPEVSSTEAPCLTTKFVLHFLPCLAIYCSSSAAEENFLSCAERCELLDLEQHCISCLIMAVGASPVQRYTHVSGTIVCIVKDFRNATINSLNLFQNTVECKPISL